jgi:hypothetical protein
MSHIGTMGNRDRAMKRGRGSGLPIRLFRGARRSGEKARAGADQAVSGVLPLCVLCGR